MIKKNDEYENKLDLDNLLLNAGKLLYSESYLYIQHNFINYSTHIDIIQFNLFFIGPNAIYKPNYNIVF